MSKHNLRAESLIVTLFVDYDLSFDETIALVNNLVEEHITQERCPITRRQSGRVDLCLFRPTRGLTNEEVLTELDERGFRAAELSELCALGAARPELSKQWWIAALGSQWVEPSGLTMSQSMSHINDFSIAFNALGNPSRGLWDHDFLILAVRK